MTAMLEVKDLEVSYGKIKAVKKISFNVDEGEVVTLIGTNGAGKTTTLRTISGLLKPSGGEITFKGKRIDGVPAHEIVMLGLAHSPEGRQTAARGYKEAYQKALKKSEAVLESEPIPLGHRQTIRRYFESIRPQNDDGKGDPADAAKEPAAE